MVGICDLRNTAVFSLVGSCYDFVEHDIYRFDHCFIHECSDEFCNTPDDRCILTSLLRLQILCSIKVLE